MVPPGVAWDYRPYRQQLVSTYGRRNDDDVIIGDL